MKTFKQFLNLSELSRPQLNNYRNSAANVISTTNDTNTLLKRTKGATMANRKIAVGDNTPTKHNVNVAQGTVK